MRITAILGVPSVKPKGHIGLYPFLARALSNLLTDVQPDPPEQSIRGVGHLFRRLRLGNIEFRVELKEPFSLKLPTDEMEVCDEENL